MNDYQTLSHTKWDCKYHGVFIPKGRRKALYGPLRAALGEVVREVAQHKESKVEEGHLRPDHVHMLLSIPPQDAVAHSPTPSMVIIAARRNGDGKNADAACD